MSRWGLNVGAAVSARRSVAAAIAGFGGLGLIVLLAGPVLHLDSQGALHGWLGAAVGPWSLPAAIAAFAVFAFLGVPQFALIAAAIVAFGPVWGAVDSWAGTLVSAVVGFWLGRRLGAGAVSGLAGPRVSAILSGIGRNGFGTMLVVRQIPSAPFILVNMVAGATPMATLDYVAGTAIGIVPKIALTAVAGRSVLQIPHGGAPGAIAALALAALAWTGVSLLALAWLGRRRRVADGRAAAADCRVPAE